MQTTIERLKLKYIIIPVAATSCGSGFIQAGCCGGHILMGLLQNHRFQAETAMQCDATKSIFKGGLNPFIKKS
jgi:hypothetical protein